MKVGLDGDAAALQLDVAVGKRQLAVAVMGVEGERERQAPFFHLDAVHPAARQRRLAAAAPFASEVAA